MRNVLVETLFGLRDFLNGINNTTWGIMILCWTMHMYGEGTHLEATYYFAGVASTLIGVSHFPQNKISGDVNIGTKEQ